MVRPVTGDLSEQVKNNQSVNMAARKRRSKNEPVLMVYRVPSLLSAVREGNLPGKGTGILSAEYAGVSRLVCSNADCPGAGSGIPDGESAPSRRGLGDRSVPALTGSLADRSDPDREELRQGAERGRIPAERSLSYHTGHPSGSRTVRRSDDPECVDPVGFKHRVRAAGVDPAAESGETVYL